MIQASELIINRWFLLNLSYVRAVDFNGLNSLYNSIDELQPIELSEEILLKCGFEKVKGTSRDCIKLIQKGEGGGNPNWELYVDFGDDKDAKEMLISLVNDESDWFYSKAKNLHQLQNLYFALTQTELEINL